MTPPDRLRRWWDRQRDLADRWAVTPLAGRWPRPAIGATVGVVVLAGVVVGTARLGPAGDAEVAAHAATAQAVAAQGGSGADVNEPDPSETGSPGEPSGELIEFAPAAAAIDEGYDVVVVRDPFERVVPEPDPADPDLDLDPGSDPAQPGDGTPPPVGADPDGSTLPDIPTPPDGTAPEGTSACFGQEEVVCDGRVVTIVPDGSGDLASDTVRIRVDDEVYEARSGDVVAERFRVAGVANGCASIQYGEDAFLVCEPEPGSK